MRSQSRTVVHRRGGDSLHVLMYCSRRVRVIELRVGSSFSLSSVLFIGSLFLSAVAGSEVPSTQLLLLLRLLFIPDPEITRENQ